MDAKYKKADADAKQAKQANTKLDGDLKIAQNKVTEQTAKVVKLDEANKQLAMNNKSLEQKTNALDLEVKKLTDQVNMLDYQKYRLPDPDLATLVVVVDGTTNFTFLQRDLIDFYTYHNGRSPANQPPIEYVVLDVFRGRSLLAGAMTLPKEVKEIDINDLLNALEFQRPGSPQPDDIVTNTKFNLIFSPQYTKKKKHQIVLIAGARCPVATVEAWKSFPHPVHVCIVNDARGPLPQAKQTGWTQFCQQKKRPICGVQCGSQLAGFPSVGARTSQTVDGRTTVARASKNHPLIERPNSL